MQMKIDGRRADYKSRVWQAMRMNGCIVINDSLCISRKC